MKRSEVDINLAGVMESGCTHMPLRQQTNGSNTLCMFNMDVWSDLSQISDSNMTLWHWLPTSGGNLAGVTVSSSLGRAKNSRYQLYLVPLKIIIVWFHTKITIFLLHQLKVLNQSFPMVSWLTFGSKNWPQTSLSPIVTLSSLAASVFSVSLTKKYSAISQPHPALKPYHQFVHGLNSLFVWFQRRVWLADGVVSWWHNTMSDQRQKRWIGGSYFYLLQAPFSTAVAKKHHPHALSWSSVAAGAAQAPYWLLPLQQWQRCQCDALMMHCTLNSLINTINDN